ncbi:uncharacterized protein BKA55DRAFT_326195 [Fusarium redolens]|uniref:Uncharacterized protein n=1 Tax=Fusarium redolens TaxID=48865 RepID=A0A9P9KFW3_FUSRE|nr:uncharacterized protein BKA55DRAFT_326195 [Fusarium redolens]KAH7255690.1 hypothetical protein BKA55DRAFT_326195 [Fusarium redolens]
MRYDVDENDHDGMPFLVGKATCIAVLPSQTILSLAHGLTFLNVQGVLYLLVGSSIRQRTKNLPTHIVRWRLRFVLFFFFFAFAQRWIALMPLHFSLDWK